MKRLSSQELSAAHRIFRRVDNISGGYYGYRTEAQVKKYVSQNRWIMFPVYNVPSLREGATFPAPNVYISFNRDEIKDNGDGQVNGWVGVTYNNVEAMLWLREILRVRNAPYFINTLNALSQGWHVYSGHKIKTNYKDNTPVYNNIETIDARTVDITGIKSALKKSDGTTLQQGMTYLGEPVIWCVSVLNASIETNESKFDKDVKEAFDLFIRVLSLR